MHIHIVPSLFFMKSIGTPQGDTLGPISPFFINSCNYNLSSTNSGALMWYGYFKAVTDPCVSSMEKSKSLFRGSPCISSGNTSLNSMRTWNSSIWCSLSTSTSWMLTAKRLQPFLIHFLACKVDIYLTKTHLGMPWIFVWFPCLSMHNNDLFRYSSITWCCSN